MDQNAKAPATAGTAPGIGRLIGADMQDGTAEEWLPVLGFEGKYEVSNLGNVRSLTRTVVCRGGYSKTIQGCRMTPVFIGQPGDKREALRLASGGKYTAKLLAVLVLEAFRGARPPGMHGCHNDGNPRNNRLDNLRWDTPAANMRDKVRHGTNHELNKTRCPQGHEYTPENTTVRGRKRRCKACHRADSRLRYRLDKSA